MLQRIAEARKKESGFTLIELLMVIVILGVLAGIVVFAVQGINDRGEVSACKSEVSTVGVAQEAHFAQEGKYAASIAALQTAGLLREGSAGRYVETNAEGDVITKADAPC